MDRLLSMQVFERVANEGGFAAAARAMNVSPPAVTRLIAELESYLGTRLFQRTTRRVSLTEAGEAYLARVRQILQDVEEADAIASADTDTLSGRLRVHAQPVLATYVIAPLLSAFRQRHPGIVVDIEVETYRDPPIEDFDITLLGADANFNANIVARKIVESLVVLVASPAYVQRRGSPKTPEDLAQHECLRLRRPSGGPLRAWRMWSEENTGDEVEVNVDPVLIANHTDTLLRAALDGAGITSIPLDMAAPYLTRGDLVRVLNPWFTGRLGMYAALPSRKFIPQRSRVFLDYLVAHTREQNREALRVCTAC
ncbi:LysR family transcriptional regulator [Pusillimonas sp. SM2304]|uniref:LysR family transcriptional regulator n=1 Tax=Pusillimonas sp. SM2304 TaxID=3073241 RepID=UPI0028772312|nr:LysR family transcriptional regulator [Pusillimonas sp. SM2304]MDS1141556.1 LysR family transcriptional regulator [Pusillimonas sp. SM2304]